MHVRLKGDTRCNASARSAGILGWVPNLKLVPLGLTAEEWLTLRGRKHRQKTSSANCPSLAIHWRGWLIGVGLVSCLLAVGCGSAAAPNSAPATGAGPAGGLAPLAPLRPRHNGPGRPSQNSRDHGGESRRRGGLPGWHALPVGPGPEVWVRNGVERRGSPEPAELPGHLRRVRVQ